MKQHEAKSSGLGSPAGFGPPTAPNRRSEGPRTCLVMDAKDALEQLACAWTAEPVKAPWTGPFAAEHSGLPQASHKPLTSGTSLPQSQTSVPDRLGAGYSSSQVLVGQRRTDGACRWRPITPQDEGHLLPRWPESSFFLPVSVGGRYLRPHTLRLEGKMHHDVPMGWEAKSGSQIWKESWSFLVDLLNPRL